jgi:endonuclease III
MKNATKHADTLKSLFRSLMKEHKPAAFEKTEPLNALVRGAMSYDVSDHRADEAMRVIDREFVNLNELRVATDLEIQEMLGQKYPDIENRVQMITSCLNSVFEKEHTLSLERLKTISRRDARQYVRELPNITPFVEAYVMLYGCEAPAVPVDREIHAYLREEEVFDEKIDVEEGQRFLEHHLKVEDCHDFFWVVRRAAHADVGRGRKKARA